MLNSNVNEINSNKYVGSLFSETSKIMITNICTNDSKYTINSIAEEIDTSS